MELAMTNAPSSAERFDIDIELRDAALAAAERACRRGDRRLLTALAGVREDRDALVAGRARERAARGERETVWLDCRDLWMAGIHGAQPHSPDNLIPGEAECYCERSHQESPFVCANPEERRIPDSRFGLRLCCRCACRWEAAIASALGYRAGQMLAFHRERLAVRRLAERRLLAITCRILHAETSAIGTWRRTRTEVAK